MDAFLGLVRIYGPHTALAMVGWLWAAWERKQNILMVRQLLELAKAQTEVAYKSEAAIEKLRDQLR